MVVALRRSEEVDRAIRPAGPSSYTVEVLPVLKPVRKIRAIRLNHHTRHDLITTGLMMPFLGLYIADLMAVPMWAAIPGCAIIAMSMIISVAVLASNTPRR